MASPLVPDELWEVVEPLIPKVERRYRHPGRKRIPDRRALTGILFVLKTGIPWEELPQEILAKLNAAGEIDWQRAAVDSSHVRAFGGASAAARAQ